MRHIPRALPGLIALATWLSAPAPVAASRLPTERPQMLFFDALITHARSAGPGVESVGHRQIATGGLRDAVGRPTGTFSFTCTWTRVTADGAAESCLASAWTRDGRLDAAGGSVSSVLTHSWGIAGGTGAYRHAHGNLLLRDLSSRESLITATINTQDGAALHAGKLSRQPANHRFTVRANGLCQQAAQRLAALPPFPFANFDPLHPDPSFLPQVGAFFTGPGDPRPTLSTLGADLQALGSPPANHNAWTATLRARHAQLSIIDQQDRAALTGDLHDFVDSVHASAANFRQIAITATVFGATQCVF